MTAPNPNPGICYDCGCSLGPNAHWIKMRCEPCAKEWKCFLHKRFVAAQRGVGWELTFQEWRDIWESSGKVALRGRGKGKYCMARNGDTGPYRADNVSIQSVEQNSFDAAKLVRAGWIRNGTPPKGWVYMNALPKRPYQVVVARKYIGNYATQEEAEAAYAAEVERRGYIQSTDSLCLKRQHQIKRVASGPFGAPTPVTGSAVTRPALPRTEG